MCLLIDNSNGVALERSMVERAALINADGYGRLCLTTGRVKKTLDMEKAVRLALEPGPAIHHFRWATVGVKTKANCHPFPIDNGYYLFQNGTVDGFVDNGSTDTARLADMLRHVNPEARPAVLSMFDQRYIIVNAKRRTVQRTGDGWVEHEGVWYSNASCINTGKMVAVYGTLKSGNGNNYFMDKAKFIGWGTTSEKHRLCISGLPYLIEGGDGHRVEVEVYEVDAVGLAHLDRLEGHPLLYERRETQVELDGGDEITAWIYFAPETCDNGVYSKSYGPSWLDDPVEVEMQCPRCGSDDIKSDEGYLYCEDCGHFTSDIREDLWLDQFGERPVPHHDFDQRVFVD